MVKFSTSENLKTNKIYLDNWRPDQKDSNWSKSVNFIELEPKCRLETFFDENFEKPMGIWRGGYDKKSVHQAWILFFQSLNVCIGIQGPMSWSIRTNRCGHQYFHLLLKPFPVGFGIIFDLSFV